MSNESERPSTQEQRQYGRYSRRNYLMRNHHPIHLTSRMSQIKQMATNLYEQLKFISDMLYMDIEDNEEEEAYDTTLLSISRQLTACYNISRAIRLKIRDQLSLRGHGALPPFTSRFPNTYPPTYNASGNVSQYPQN